MPTITSGQLTEKLKNSHNVLAEKQEMFENVRYFVAQHPVTNDFTDTCDGYYRGHKVIPGPKANPDVSSVIDVRDIRILESRHFIRFVDDLTTPDADEFLREAIFTIMTKAEADEYEAKLKELKELKRKKEIK